MGKPDSDNIKHKTEVKSTSAEGGLQNGSVFPLLAILHGITAQNKHHRSQRGETGHRWPGEWASDANITATFLSASWAEIPSEETWPASESSKVTEKEM